MIIITAFAVASVPNSFYWCWQCGLSFTAPAQGDKILCTRCGFHVTVAGAKLWHEGTAWCPTCHLSYGIIQVIGREPECPICHHLPNGEKAINATGQSPNAAPAAEVD